MDAQENEMQKLKEILKRFSSEEIQSVLSELPTGIGEAEDASAYTYGHDEYGYDACFLQKGAVVQAAVARIVCIETGNFEGTGFMVSPSLFMTNYHIINCETAARAVKMEFNYQVDCSGNELRTYTYLPDPDSFLYTYVDLDFALVRMKCHHSTTITAAYGTSGNGERAYQSIAQPQFHLLMQRQAWEPILMASLPGIDFGYLRLPRSINCGEYVTTIHHPRGQHKSFEIGRKTRLEEDEDCIHHDLTIANGSSGSPIFNFRWELIGIHNRRLGCEHEGFSPEGPSGIRIDRIVDHLRDHFHDSESGREILAELGIL